MVPDKLLGLDQVLIVPPTVPLNLTQGIPKFLPSPDKAKTASRPIQPFWIKSKHTLDYKLFGGVHVKLNPPTGRT